MTFWNDSNFEPKRVFKWKVSVLSTATSTAAGVYVPSWYAKKVTKPQLTVEEAEHKHLNKSFYFPGHLKWEPVTVTLIDSVEGDVVSAVTQAFSNSNYDPVAKKDGATNMGFQGEGLKTIKKGTIVNNSTALTAKVLMEQINSEGEVVEAITLHNAWIKSFKPTELTYDSEDLSMYDIEFRYDWASYTNS